MIWGRLSSVTIIESSMCTAAEVEFPHYDVLSEDICNYQEVHPFPVEQICHYGVPWKGVAPIIG